MTPDDRELVKRARSGDRQAFRALVEQSEVMVRTHCLHMLGSFDEAQDAAQDAYLKAFLALGSFREDSKFSTWVVSIARNHCLDLLRKRKSQFALRKAMEQKEQLNAAQNNNGFAAALESQQIVGRVLAQLPADQRSIIILREVQGLSYEEIAEVLHCSLESVRAQLKRARQKFIGLGKQLLDKEEPTHGYA